MAAKNAPIVTSGIRFTLGVGHSRQEFLDPDQPERALGLGTAEDVLERAVPWSRIEGCSGVLMVAFE
jgi:hypothetical protein